MQRQELSEVSGGCGLAAAAFEVHDRDHLQMLPCPAVRYVAAVAPRTLVELRTNVGNVTD